MDRLTEAEKSAVNEIIVVAPENIDPCENVIRVCDPEDWFDIVEHCKICGRCV